MTRTFIDKNGNSWEWEETPEVIKALNTLHETVRQNQKSMPVVITDGE